MRKDSAVKKNSGHSQLYPDPTDWWAGKKHTKTLLIVLGYSVNITQNKKSNDISVAYICCCEKDIKSS